MEKKNPFLWWKCVWRAQQDTTEVGLGRQRELRVRRQVPEEHATEYYRHNFDQTFRAYSAILLRTHAFLLPSFLFLIPYRPRRARKFKTLDTQLSVFGMAPLRISIVNCSATHMRITVGSLSIRTNSQISHNGSGMSRYVLSVCLGGLRIGLASQFSEMRDIFLNSLDIHGSKQRLDCFCAGEAVKMAMSLQ
jgi:hypothetical protein